MVNNEIERMARERESDSRSASSAILPYGANINDLLKLIDVIKTTKHNANKIEIERIYSKSNINLARNILKVLDISQDGLNLSKNGRNYVYEIDQNQKQRLLLKTLLKYPAYEYLLLHIFCQDFRLEADTEEHHLRGETGLSTIEKYWEQYNYGISQINRNKAAILFGQLAQLAGLGKLILGRRGMNSRIQWKENAKYSIAQCLSEAEIEKINHKLAEKTNNLRHDRGIIQRPSSKIHNITNINVKADISNWNMDKILTFLKAARGNFEVEIR
jgi:hypothetical protein